VTPGEEAEGRRRDARARAVAQTDFDRPIVIEAGAGTGKTATLVARVVAWAMGPGWARAQASLPADEPANDPERIAARVLTGLVAITFTEAAAAEMAQRVEAALESIEQGRAVIGLEALWPDLPEEERRQRARALLESLEYLNVNTIHAWCRGLLARFPLEAGLHPLFRVDAEGDERDRCVREEVETALRAALAESRGQELVQLAGLGSGPAEVEGALSALVAAGVRSEDLDDPFAPERIAQLAGDCRQGLEALIRAGALDLIDARRAKMTVAVAAAVAAWRDRPTDAPPPVDRDGLAELRSELASSWSAAEVERLGQWAAGRFSPTEEGLLGGRCEAVAAAAGRAGVALRSLLEGDFDRLALVYSVLSPLLDRVRRQLDRRGVLGFDDLLERTRDLLERDPGVRSRLRREIDGLLVDEFQDTDRQQCEIVAALALGGAVEERPWLFVVGDPKQSIYGWRSADLEAYESFVERVRADGGEVLPLVVNHRSDPPILEEVARVLRPVMHHRPGLQPEFEPLLASPVRSAGSGFDLAPQAPVEHWACWSLPAEGGPPAPARSAHESNEQEARGLACDLLRLRAASPDDFRWSSVAVLMRSMTDVETFLAELRAAGIPYSVARDRSYYRRREIIDAAAVVRCVLDPHDQLALLTCLRSPAVGVPDAALVPLWAHGLPGRVGELWGPDPEALAELTGLVASAAREVPEEAPGLEGVRGWEVALLAALENLALLRAAFETEPADRFVERMRHLWLGEATEAARFLGAYRVANLDRFFRELADLLGEGSDAEEVLRKLREGIARQREVEQAAAPEARRDAVQVMSIHKAKGLTFDHVYLLQLGKGPPGGRRSSVELGRSEAGLEWSLLGASSLGFAAARARASTVAQMEQVRALYVAMTRPRLRLVLSGRWADGTSASEPEAARSLAALVANREGGVEDWAARAADPAAIGGRDGTTARGACWRFPALFEPVEVPGGVAAEGGGESVAIRASRSMELFREQAPAAAARMQRRFSGRASADDDEPETPGDREARVEARFGGAAEEEALAGAPPERRERAMAVGTAIHRLLEDWDHAAASADELRRQRARIGDVLAPMLPEPERESARTEAEAILDALAAGGLLQRLGSLADRIVARELPVLRPPGEDPAGAVLFESGVIDLVYRDPASDELVVADYKTDRVASRKECVERALHYRSQGRFYTECLRDALGLAEAPRFELWFLRAGEVVR